jgi:hypothetical protein
MFLRLYSLHKIHSNTLLSSAFLNPKDVRKFMQYYDECSKKKMRGLAPAIEAA